MDINPSEITKILKEQIKNRERKLKSQRSAKSFLLEMELQGYMALTMFRLEKWLNLKMVLKVWR